MKIDIRKSEIEDLRKLPPIEKKRIHAAIHKLKDFHDIANCKKLTNFEPAYREHLVLSHASKMRRQ